eukprot:TRINITY_DN5701_c0_g1_i1.p1 TRINITY_DN5701_c0_g1~~TRINITY_DN5701_c0_g1_i1.p1  ORF type:complete len:248 (+),score=14.16 TRINITY_DN5701_c0_g1_i1:67-810(+)
MCIRDRYQRRVHGEYFQLFQMNQQEDNNPNEILFKIIIVGDACVGKSSILNQFIKKSFSKDYNLTIGVEFASTHVNIGGQRIKLQIWDAAGQETFKSIVKSFYRKAGAVFLVYNVFNRESLDSVASWYKEAKETANERMVSVLIGNQTDRQSAEERKVSYEDGIQFQKEHGITIFYETSAKSGDNVQTVFHETTRLIYQRFLDEENLEGTQYTSLNLNKRKDNYSSIPLDKKHLNQELPQQQKKGCC